MLIRNSGRYLLSEVFSQDPVERYFSQQRHRGVGNENPTVERFQTNAVILMQRQQNRHVLPDRHDIPTVVPIDEPLPKISRKH